MELTRDDLDLLLTWLEGVDPDEAMLWRAGLQLDTLTGLDPVDGKRRVADRARRANTCACDANLRGANLQEAKLGGANLQGAFLVNADLSRADLRDANLSGADLRGANLHHADLRGAQVTKEQLAQTASLQGATLPDGTEHE